MTGRRTRWALDVVLTGVVAFLVALSVGRIVVWLRWVIGQASDDHPWWAAMPALGGVLAVLIVVRARTTPATADAYVRGIDDGALAIGPAPARFLALVSGVGVGVPLGYEGPMVYFGGSLGAWAARRLGRPDRWCILAAATSAVAMVIGAPIAAALFASEVARRGLPRRRDVMPLAIGAVASWAARRLTGESGGIVGTDLGLTAGQVAVGALAIGVAAGVAARPFVVAVRRAKELHLSVGARVVGVVVTLGVAVPLGWWAADAPIFIGSGERLREWAAHTSQGPLLLATLVFAGLVIAMVACGVVGGLFLPLLSLGALLGVLVGRAWLPDVPYAACVGIGACCLLAAGYGTPLTAIALAFTSFGWSSSAWLTAMGVVIASAIARERSVSVYQRSARAGRGRRTGMLPTWWSGRHVRS
ncbi:MAG: chloride channel protein [Actinobacteria bacterium]|nr:chloride channel protein [Actinomycetota bacterium]